MSGRTVIDEKETQLQDNHPPMADIERGYAGNGRGADNMELRHLRSESTFSLSGATAVQGISPENHVAIQESNHPGSYLPQLEDYHFRDRTSKRIDQVISSERRFWARFTGRDRRERGEEIPGWLESFKNVAICSYLNALLIFIPVAWVAHFLRKDWGNETVFALCFIAIIPLEQLFDWGGEQISMYLGKDLGDLVTVTLNNTVEATLAIILLSHCELRLLQSTIVGVIILHLLLIPGTAFLAGGARVWEQSLHPHQTQLNHSLLTIGVLTVLLPTAFFAALDRGVMTISANGEAAYAGTLVNDETRDQLLRMSRGLAVMLLVVYVCSRIFLTNPPGDDNAGKLHELAPEEQKHEEEHLKHATPDTNPWVCIMLLIVTVAIMAVTAEFLVESVESVRETGRIQEEWFGLIILPLVSFSADGTVAVVFFIHSAVNHILGRKTMVPSTLAKARAIDLSIQFTIFWVPFLVLLAWWISKPLHLMFDYFELAMLLGSCFLVNYVTADAKTNWIEGLILIVFYMMIATCAWFYSGQPELTVMLACPKSVADFLLTGGEH